MSRSKSRDGTDVIKWKISVIKNDKILERIENKKSYKKKKFIYINRGIIPLEKNNGLISNKILGI